MFRIFIFFIFIGFSSVTKAHLLDYLLGESFYYELHYQGTYSLNKKLFVANIKVSTKPQYVILPNGEKALDSRLDITTARSKFAEMLYPLRFHIRSLYQLTNPRLILLEKYKKVRKRLRHALFIADGKGTIVRYRADKLNPKKPPLPKIIQKWLGINTQFRLYSQNKEKIAPQALDQLSLINLFRTLNLAQGQCQLFPITSGKIAFKYTICGAGKTLLQLAHKKQAAIQLKLTATELKKGKIIKSHAPLNVWLSDNKKRIPLRFSMQDSTGLYQIDLISHNLN